MSDDNKPVKITTARGIAVWPKLDEPDTKYKPEGEFNIKVRLSAEDAAPIISTLEPIIAQAEALLKKAKAEEKNPAKRAKIKDDLHPGYVEVADDQGNLTGEYEFNFKMKASGVSKKTGKPWTMRPAIFDAKGQPAPKGIKVGGGSTVKVMGVAAPFQTNGVGYGVTLRLEAVQVIKLRTFAERSASQYGFAAEDDEDAFDAAGVADESATPAQHDEGQEPAGSADF